MDADRCAHSEHTRNFSATLPEVKWSEQIFSLFLCCLIQSFPIHMLAALAYEASRLASLMHHCFGHVVSYRNRICFCFTLRLGQDGLPRVWVFHFSSFFQCGGNLQLLLMV